MNKVNLKKIMSMLKLKKLSMLLLRV